MKQERRGGKEEEREIDREIEIEKRNDTELFWGLRRDIGDILAADLSTVENNWMSLGSRR